MGRKLWGLLAPTEFLNETERELKSKGLRPLQQHENFFLFEGEAREMAWAAVVWRDVESLPITSINEAAKKLRTLAKKWELLPLLHRRRATLIFDQLRSRKRELISFPSAISLPEASGAFTFLENEKEIFWCRDFDRPDPLGRLEFVEDKESAPSRAYLKLWEAFCLLGEWPSQGQRCLDLGSSPGGWTWVLASLGAEVISVDRSDLGPRIAQMPGVQFRRGDAFQALPSNTEPVDWLCSDVICTPEKLLTHVQEWVASGKARRFVCTLKFQGVADPKIVAAFAEMGRVLHLHHNKHELTFIR